MLEALLPALDFTGEQVRDRLVALGWLPVHADLKDIREAVKALQEFYGLKVDGIPGPITQRAMFTPRRGRCALPDILPTRDQLCRWPFANVPVAPLVELRQLTAEQIEAAFRSACQAWNRICGIDLTVTDDIARAWIIAREGQGRRDNLDGPGGTLAWSELPCGSNPRKLNQRYDAAERWTGDFLRMVAMHEIGHAIGIDHLSFGNVMAPTYDDSLSDLQPGDIAEAQLRYGPPTNPPSNPSPPADPNPQPSPIPDDQILSALRGRELVLRVSDIR
jgi:hypothetical protein